MFIFPCVCIPVFVYAHCRLHNYGQFSLTKGLYFDNFIASSCAFGSTFELEHEIQPVFCLFFVVDLIILYNKSVMLWWDLKFLPLTWYLLLCIIFFLNIIFLNIFLNFIMSFLRNILYVVPNKNIQFLVSLKTH